MRKTVPALALSIGITLASATTAGATPVETGCPSGSEAKTVAEWVAAGYMFVPPMLDAEGNQDGIVCGRAMPDGFRFGRLIKALGIEPSVDVIYNFADNDIPAAKS
jgi:hypothetical protein